MITKDRRGQRFGRLTVMRQATTVGRRRTRWVCLCDCGREVVTRTELLVAGKKMSCGCLPRGGPAAHGDARPGRQKRLYRIWRHMRQRCQKEASADFPLYGGRGIEVCAEWEDYRTFRAWALANGYRDDLSIDRIDNDGNYEPGNCRWATPRQQARNTRASVFVTHDGETLTIGEWSERTGLRYLTLWQRLKVYGWPVERALTTPVAGPFGNPKEA